MCHDPFIDDANYIILQGAWTRAMKIAISSLLLRDTKCLFYFSLSVSTHGKLPLREGKSYSGVGIPCIHSN